MKIQKKIIIFFLGGGGGWRRVWGQGGCERRSKVFVKIQKKKKKFRGGGGGRVGVRGRGGGGVCTILGIIKIIKRGECRCRGVRFD